ncbi:MAG: PqiC family protein [Pseudoalteromonas sp.]|uniref:PqiC family protein n=1 Tax=unclassified Pseudoalteromonas TaxID=194690 RepID=UPI003F9482CC
MAIFSSIKLVIISSLVLLTACSQSLNAPIEYYQFEQPISTASRSAEDTRYQLRLSTVDLRGALNNRGIAIKMENNQVNAANYHLWSEAPDKMLSASAHYSLFTALPDWMVVKGLPVVTDKEQQSYYELEYELHQFNGDNKGNAIIAGLWRLYQTTPEQGRSLQTLHYFNETTPLVEDGYEGLVTTLSLNWQAINLRTAEYLNEAN